MVDVLARSKRPIYRKDIDGIRCFAVLAVILFHLNAQYLSGGFLGVDCFFVISGFLITSNILDRYEVHSFSYKDFYIRRMRRIFPALFFMLFIMSIFAFIILLPKDLYSYAGQLVSTLLCVSNFYFYKIINVGYFSTDSSIIPLLHTWSLGVEEQFYLFWPLCLLCLLFVFRQKRNKVFASTFLLFFLSYLLFLLFSHHKLFSYYLPFTRAFQVLMGCMIALYPKRRINNLYLSNTLGFFGVLLVMFAFFCFTKDDFFSYRSIIAPLGVSLLIIAGMGSSISNMILSFSGFRFIGWISYSMYLWHWPIIAFFNYLHVHRTLLMNLYILSFVVFISSLSWIFIEAPFRKMHRSVTMKKMIISFFLVPVSLGLVVLFLLKFNPNLGYNHLIKLNHDAPSYYGAISPRNNCHNENIDKPYKIGEISKCTIGYKNMRADILLVGDSHAMSYSGMVDLFLKKIRKSAYLVSQSGTPFILLDDKLTSYMPNKYYSSILRRNITVERLIDSGRFRYVFLFGAWSYSGYGLTLNKLAFEKSVLETINYLVSNHVTPVVFLDYPPLLAIPRLCGYTKLHFFQNCYNDESKIIQVLSVEREVFQKAKLKFPQLILVDPLKVFCVHKKCFSHFSGFPVYMDGNENSHLSYKGAVIMGKRYLEQFGNPLGIIR